MRSWVALCAVLALPGCDMFAGKIKNEQPAQSPPVGRYQIVGDHDFGVYVLDTRDGKLTKCATTMTDETWCTPSIRASDGTGVPAWLKRRPAPATVPAQ